MHPNPVYRQAPAARNIAFARARGFGVLSTNGDPAPLLAHVPFVLSPDGSLAELHLVRSNPIAMACADSLDAVIAVSGADGYISPDWYGIADQVPTWNYLSVVAEGPVRRLSETDLAALLDDLSAAHEARLLPKKPWTRAKMTPGRFEAMLPAIHGFEMSVETLRGTRKLGQNKRAAEIEGAAAGLEAAGRGDVAALMRRHAKASA